MKVIEIEDDLYRYILTNIEAFGETPSQILRRLLSIPAPAAKTDMVEHHEVAIDNPDTTISEPSDEIICPAAEPSLPDALAHGVEALMGHASFQNEAIVTNKFKMLLTAMYYEKTSAFVEAAKVVKGRSRDYLGQNLEALLASDNEEEVALLVASKPRDIPFTPFWVVTNANTGRKRIILTQMMSAMDYDPDLIARIQDEI
ncbi:replication initiation regulator SeqA [Psychromonas sp. MME2]|uniref:replication initiation regulator SeqA n=1 Tax=unclassified Psychromonas TaxID=2614957 RepID=UPI00339C796C